MRRAFPCLWQCQNNHLIYALKYKSRSYTTNVTMMVASHVRLNIILIWYIGPMEFSWNATSLWLMVCWIWYIAVWTRWMRVRVSVVQVCCINHKGISKHCWGFWTLSPMQPGNHKGHDLFRSLEWTHQCARVRWHPGSSTKYCADQTLYESQRCNDVVGVEHVRNNHPERH